MRKKLLTSDSKKLAAEESTAHCFRVKAITSYVIKSNRMVKGIKTIQVSSYKRLNAHHTRIDSLTVSFFPNVEEEYREINNIIIEENAFFFRPLNKFSSVFDLLREMKDRRMRLICEK